MIDGFERAVNAAGDRVKWARGDAPPSVMQPTFAHRAEYAALRGAVAAVRRSASRAPARSASAIGRLGFSPLGIRRASSSGSSRRRSRHSDRAEIERIARAAYGHLGRTSIETAILPSYSPPADHRSVRGGARLEHRRRAARARQRADRRHRTPRQLGAGRRVRRRARLADRRGGAPHGESAVRSLPHAHARAHRHDGRPRRRGGARVPRSLRAGRVGGVSRRSGRGRSRVDVGAVLRPLRQDAARTGGVRASTRRADRVRRRAAPAVGPVSCSRSRRSTSIETGDREADVDRIVADYTLALERWVRRAPEQYFWHHRRWKHQRPGTPPELGDPL